VRNWRRSLLDGRRDGDDDETGHGQSRAAEVTAEPAHRASAAAADTDTDAARHRDQVNAGQLAACRRVAQRLVREGILAKPWTTASATELLWALLSPDLITRLMVASQWGATDFADRLAVLLHRTLTTDGGPPASGSWAEPASHSQVRPAGSPVAAGRAEPDEQRVTTFIPAATRAIDFAGGR
jgi:hypothetical protein